MIGGALASSHDYSPIIYVITRVVPRVCLARVAHASKEVIHLFLVRVDEITIRD